MEIEFSIHFKGEDTRDNFTTAISPKGRPKKYDVFISFRGEDTRDNFTSHLHGALRRKTLETYIDNRLERGDVISQALVEAIKESYASLIIFSENYASSKWCLDELVEIMECKELERQIVIPVFYKMDPSHVRKQLGSYKNAFIKHERDLKHNKNKVLRWKTALTEAANLAGFHFHSPSNRTEHELIEEIVKDVQKKLKLVYPSSEFRDLVGFHQNFAQIETLLAINSNDVRIIGIWGMGGIGKTTLASALFNRYSSQYEGRCFLEDVRAESKKHGPNHLRKKLHSELLGEDNHEFFTPGIVPTFVKRRLSSKKVFIVLDDVNSSEQIECLIGKHDCLGRGSRVILTTRDKRVLISGGIERYYEVKQLNFEESIQLFSLNAFNKSNPEMGYEELSVKAVTYAKGVPLALKVLGSFLRLKSEEEWESALRRLKKSPNQKIQSVLRLSYDELEYYDKKIFLDIACFMKGWDKNHAKRVLDGCGFFPHIGMRNLEDKALITISCDNKVEMHDLIQGMGQEIVRQESIEDPERRSRLWDSEELYHVLRNKRGTHAIEGIVLDTYEFEDLYLESNVFKKMINLRFLIVNTHWSAKFNSYTRSDIESLPDNLRYLYWSGYPLKSLPSTFHPEKLVVLRMPHSQVKKLWDGVQNLANLEEILLSNSRNLLELPDLSRAKNLECVNLDGCTSLRDVQPSILSLPKLKELSLRYCKALKSLKSNNHSTSLEDLSLEGCSSLQEFSVTSENMKCLDLTFTAIDELPPSVLLLKNLELFMFRVSESLNKLPDNFVDSLYLAGGYCQRDLSTLRIILDRFCYLRDLSLIECTLSELPDNINQLASLEYLSLDRSHLVRLPENIKHLSQLKYLGLSESEKLQSLPELPPLIRVLDARNCTSLEILFVSSEPPKKYVNAHFFFQNCIKLDQHALDTFIVDPYRRIRAKNLLSPWAIKEQGSNDKEDCEKYTKIGFCFPGNKLPDWFSYHSTQPLLTIEIPSCSKLLGLAFCVIVRNLDALDDIVDLECECCLDGNNGEITSRFTSWFGREIYESYRPVGGMQPDSDHVYIWYDAFFYFHIMDAILPFITICNVKLSFTFLVNTKNGKRVMMAPYEVSNEKKDMKEEAMVKSCGVQPIYVSNDRLAESLPKITRKAIFPALSSGNRKQDAS